MAEVYVLLPSYLDEGLFDQSMNEIRKAGVPYRLLAIKDTEGCRHEGVPKTRNKLYRWALEDPEMKYCVSLSNDTKFPQQGWVKLLIEQINRRPGIGAIHPIEMINHRDGQPSAIWGNYHPNPTVTRDEWLPEGDPRWDFDEIPCSSLLGRCGLIRREVLEKVGLLDEKFSPGDYEEHDYGLRMAMHGYDNVITGRVKYYHDLYAGNTYKIIYPHANGGVLLAKWGPHVQGLTPAEQLRQARSGEMKPAW